MPAPAGCISITMLMGHVPAGYFDRRKSMRHFPMNGSAETAAQAAIHTARMLSPNLVTMFVPLRRASLPGKPRVFHWLSERSQKIEDRLFLDFGKAIEPLDNRVGLRRSVG